MKDRTSLKAIHNFYEILSDLVDGLKEAQASTEWCDRMLTRKSPDERKEEVRFWWQELNRPLVKGSAKYRTAVTSLLSQPATVYHALKYRDPQAMEEASEFFKAMGLTTCSTSLGTLLWEYLEELTDESYTALRETCPRVPTSKEIADDIASRKRGKTRGNEAVLGQGAYDMLCGMYTRHQETPPDHATFAASIRTLVDTHGLTSDRCKARDCETLLLDEFKALAPLTDDDWSDFTKVFALSTMETAIPGNMMKGIEDVASQLVQDITSGKASMSSLNVEDIGQRVLSGVSNKDMEAFTQNIDKILPAIGNMNMGGFPPMPK